MIDYVMGGVNCIYIIIAFHVLPTPSRFKRMDVIASYLGFFALRTIVYRLLNGFPIEWLAPSIKYVIPTFLFLMLGKGLDYKRALYFVWLTWTAFVSRQTIRVTILTGLFGKLLLSPGFPIPADTLELVVNSLLSFAMLMLMTRVICLTDIVIINLYRIGLSLIVTVCELYILYVCTSADAATPAVGYSMPLYTLIMQFFIIGGLILFERYQRMNDIATRLKIENLATNYRVQSADIKQSAREDIAKIHHDMKNHLRVIRQMKDAPDKLDAYISGLLHEMASYENLIQTGNALLDGLLTEKIGILRELDAAVDIAIDYRKCAFIEDRDTCIIFGNAFDNAIEAIRKTKGEKSVKLSLSEGAGNIIITIINTYSGPLSLDGKRILTTKADGEIHGIGLSSIGKSVEKYNGTMLVNLNQPGIFELNLFFPVP